MKTVLDNNPDTTFVSTLTEPIPENPGFLPRFTALNERYVFDQAVQDRQEIAPWPDLATRFGAVRRSAFESIDGFDSRFPRATVEDADLYYRLEDQGHTGHLLAWIRIGHHWPSRFIPYLRGLIIRAFLWSRMFQKRKKFDDLMTSRKEALIKGLDCLILALLPFCFIWLPFIFLVLFLEITALGLKWDILKVFQHKFGLRTALAALGMHQVYSWALGIGCSAGLIYNALKKGG